MVQGNFFNAALSLMTGSRDGAVAQARSQKPSEILGAKSSLLGGPNTGRDLPIHGNPAAAGK